MIAGVAFHIALGVNLHHQADHENHDEHHRRQRVHNQPQVNGQPALDNHPVDVGHRQGVTRRHYLKQRPDRKAERAEQGGDGDIAPRLRPVIEEGPEKQRYYDKGEKGQ
ncbi:hypothetical protein ES703_75303 [subsurface metagenome]